MNTIFAQCSAQGKAGISVFRISGISALKSLEMLIGHSLDKLEARKLYLRKIYNPKNHKQIDEAMVVFFNGHSSFTGEDSVEIYAHGGDAVTKLMYQTLASLEDVRLAEPGEFAKRAFLNGKIDLTAAEGLADLINAETELQHQQAIKQLGGGLEKIYDGWRASLLKTISLIEAYIDFPEEDIPEKTINMVHDMVEKIKKDIKEHLNDNNRGERLRSGIKLAIIGKPNVGKSSLLNYLMKREIAIVSNIAGTTRDVIEGHLDIGGYPIILQDTAGIHEYTKDTIEKEGIRRAWDIAKNSDIKIIVHDASAYNSEEEYFDDLVDDNTIMLLNKIDLVLPSSSVSPTSFGHHIARVDHMHAIPAPTNVIPAQARIQKTLGLDSRLRGNDVGECGDDIGGRGDDVVSSISVSIKTKQGLDELMTKIISIAQKIASPSSSPQITRARHRAELQKAMEYISNFDLHDDLVLAAEDLRMTMRAISSITGKITVDEILGEIFSNFCIGK